MQEGRYAAKAIRERLRGRDPAPFRYVDKGNVATIGRAARSPTSTASTSAASPRGCSGWRSTSTT